jgi:hypothetical protein
MYFHDIDEAHANDEGTGPNDYNPLRRTLNNALAAHAGEDTGEDDDPKSARHALPHQFYGEVERPNPVQRCQTFSGTLIREEGKDSSEPLTAEEFALNFFCNDDFAKKFTPSSTKQGISGGRG